jgi:hypothetical protein
MEKINGKRKEIILQMTTHHTTRNRDTMNPNKKRARICIDLKINVIDVVCMVNGLTLVACQNILQIYISSLSDTECS